MLGHMLGSVLSTQKLILYNCTTAVTHTSDVCERIAAATVHDNVLVVGFFVPLYSYFIIESLTPWIRIHSTPQCYA